MSSLNKEMLLRRTVWSLRKLYDAGGIATERYDRIMELLGLDEDDMALDTLEQAAPEGTENPEGHTCDQTQTDRAPTTADASIVKKTSAPAATDIFPPTNKTASKVNKLAEVSIPNSPIAAGVALQSPPHTTTAMTTNNVIVDDHKMLSASESPVQNRNSVTPFIGTEEAKRLQVSTHSQCEDQVETITNLFLSIEACSLLSLS